jgi:ATP-dependent Zn protease
MATAEPIERGLSSRQESSALATQWRQLTRAATVVALLTSPAAFVWLHSEQGLSVGWALLATFGLVIAFRGFVDVGVRRLIPWPSLFGTDDQSLREEDIVNRRRAWYWHKKFRLLVIGLAFITTVFVIRLIKAQPGEAVTWPGTAGDILGKVGHVITSPALAQFLILPIFFLLNFVILFGPLMLMGVTQIRGYEPGDAEWGVKLEDVRGQAEAKEEVRRVVSLWQSGEAFEKAGGKRERGLLFLGAPGTGKTMLAKAIATGFNSPFVSIPGSGFAQTFIGMDAVIVRWLAWKAKRLASKWGGQCIVFIDEIDAVGMRRASLGGGGVPTMTAGVSNFEDFCFYGPNGSLTPSGDLVLETRAWRERLFAERAPGRAAPTGLAARIGGIVNQAFPGMYGMGGGLAINQLLVVMDGIDNPPFTRRVMTNRVNTFLDASYIVPRRIGKVRLRMKPPKPRNEQIYFIGATNVPIEALDPALTRPGRMGRHVWFRTPTKNDRLDIFDLYLGKVAHEEELDSPERREELARITNGYSPAFIEQVTSMALTYAHHDGRRRFGWYDIVEAMTTVESGTAVNIEYVPEETRAVAIHEAGHAVAGHVYMKGAESTRLSIRRRGSSLGHHQALEKEERFSSWRSEEMGRLIWTLGAMAAERAFYGENSTGVGGDVQSATARAAWMVGACAMGPEHVELNGNGGVRAKRNGKLTADSEEELRELIMGRFERLGAQIMNTTSSAGPFHPDPIGSVLSSRQKSALVAQMLGQAYMAAYHLIDNNRAAVEKLADALAARKELYGNELLQLLEESNPKVPEVDVRDEAAWPKI